METITGGVSDKVNTTAKAWENIHLLGSVNLSLTYRYKLVDRFYLNSAFQYKQHFQSLGSDFLKLNRLNLQIGFVYQFGRNE